jgi:hypothetical protein
VKRPTYTFVSTGGSITNAEFSKTALQQKDSTIQYIFQNFSQADVEEIPKIIPPDLDSVPQTMKLHQVSV